MSIVNSAVLAIPNTNLVICSEHSLAHNRVWLLNFFPFSLFASSFLKIMVLNYKPLANFHLKEVLTFNLSLPKKF